jgi:hypothetical protein
MGNTSYVIQLFINYLLKYRKRKKPVSRILYPGFHRNSYHLSRILITQNLKRSTRANVPENGGE